MRNSKHTTKLSHDHASHLAAVVTNFLDSAEADRSHVLAPLLAAHGGSQISQKTMPVGGLDDAARIGSRRDHGIFMVQDSTDSSTQGPTETPCRYSSHFPETPATRTPTIRQDCGYRIKNESNIHSEKNLIPGSRLAGCPSSVSRPKHRSDCATSPSYRRNCRSLSCRRVCGMCWTDHPRALLRGRGDAGSVGRNAAEGRRSRHVMNIDTVIPQNPHAATLPTSPKPQPSEHPRLDKIAGTDSKMNPT